MTIEELTQWLSPLTQQSNILAIVLLELLPPDGQELPPLVKLLFVTLTPGEIPALPPAMWESEVRTITKEALTPESCRLEAPDYFGAKALYDQSGDIESLLDAILLLPQSEQRMRVSMSYNQYLASYHRCMQCWRRGLKLGALLSAGDSVRMLCATLFHLNGFIAPTDNKLEAALGMLDKMPTHRGVLLPLLQRILRSADPGSQGVVFLWMETLMRAEGYGHHVDAWDGKLHKDIALGSIVQK